MTCQTLRDLHLHVQLTDQGADVEAIVPGIGRSIAVECKRPASKAGMSDAVRRGRSQLNKRRQGGASHGILAISIDRAVDFARGQAMKASGPVIEHGAVKLTERWARDSYTAAILRGTPLGEEGSIVAVTLIGSAFSITDGIPYQVNRTALVQNQVSAAAVSLGKRLTALQRVA